MSYCELIDYCETFHYKYSKEFGRDVNLDRVTKAFEYFHFEIDADD